MVTACPCFINGKNISHQSPELIGKSFATSDPSSCRIGALSRADAKADQSCWGKLSCWSDARTAQGFADDATFRMYCTTIAGCFTASACHFTCFATASSNFEASSGTTNLKRGAHFAGPRCFCTMGKRRAARLIRRWPLDPLYWTTARNKIRCPATHSCSKRSVTTLSSMTVCTSKRAAVFTTCGDACATNCTSAFRDAASIRFAAIPASFAASSAS
mmetsp:Transcript_110223/g.322575  ORF Transcript_110223/g.322575 Transcript_110223/m.322575 type:complete len:217 (-) Transcript_110223:244-894(-)